MNNESMTYLNDKEVFVTKVEVDDQGQISILFLPNMNFLEKLNLKNGDFLVWEVTDEEITIKKKV